MTLAPPEGYDHEDNEHEEKDTIMTWFCYPAMLMKRIFRSKKVRDFEHINRACNWIRLPF